MIVNILTKTTMPFTERLSEAVQMTLLGMCAVFAVLAVIWFVLLLFKVFFYKDPDKKSKKETATKSAEPVVDNTTTLPQETITTNNSDDVTVAAIMAAISAYIAEDPALSQEYSGGFRVVSFKRVRSKANWNSKNY